jgi:uncharacterized protein
MDEAGLDVQVISLTSPGLHNLPADEAIHLPVETNDRIAELAKGLPRPVPRVRDPPFPDAAVAAAGVRRHGHQARLDGAMIFGRTGDLR